MALDRAATALDALRAKNRMVCVVTHLEELAERMPAQVRILKSETGSRIEVTRCDTPVKWARLDSAPFTDRLVRKFRLPVTGWRGQ